MNIIRVVLRRPLFADIMQDYFSNTIMPTPLSAIEIVGGVLGRVKAHPGRRNMLL